MRTLLCTLHTPFTHHSNSFTTPIRTRVRTFVIYSGATSLHETPGIRCRISRLAASYRTLQHPLFRMDASSFARILYGIDMTRWTRRLTPAQTYPAPTLSRSFTTDTVVRRSGRLRHKYIQRCKLVTSYQPAAGESIDKQGGSRLFL